MSVADMADEVAPQAGEIAPQAEQVAAPKVWPNPNREEMAKVALGLVLGQHPADVRMEVVSAWVKMMTLEGSHADWNPWDTTQPEDGAHPYNSFGPGGSYHVWSYLSAEQGISAFLKTIGQPGYANLLAVMREPTSTEEQVCEAIALSPWTGIAGDPHLYDNIEAIGSIVVDGPGGWPFPPIAEPAPTPAPEPAPTPDAAVVDAAGDVHEAEATPEPSAVKLDLEKIDNLLAQIHAELHK